MPVNEAIDALIDVVPELRGEREVSELAGGLTNTNYKVVTDAGAYVVRISAKDAGLLAIDRDNEYRNSVSAAEAGVSDIDFDFWEWGLEKYERAVAEFDGPEFPSLLEDVTRAD